MIINKFLILIISLIMGSLYFPLNKRKSKYYWESKIDSKIPLISIFILPYLFYFLFFPLSIIILYNTKFVVEFLIVLTIGNLINSIFWYVFPNGVKRPKIVPKIFFDKLVFNLYKRDKYDTNGFPSAHVFHTLIGSVYLSIAFPKFSFISYIIGFLIIISTVFVKQHYIIDIFGGVISFIISYLIGKVF
jgi:membrane-associated phospholipid phosphatase